MKTLITGRSLWLSLKNISVDFFFFKFSFWTEIDVSDAPAKNGGPAEIKEEEKEVDEQPAAKRKRGQSKKETKSKEKPKEEIKSEGNRFN